MWKYTTILHEQRVKMGLTTNQYCVLDIIYHSQTHPDYSDNGWCKHGCGKIGNFIGLSKPAIIEMISKLESLGFVEKGENGRKKATEKFYRIYAKKGGSESLPPDGEKGVGKFTPKGSESLPPAHSNKKEKGNEEANPDFEKEERLKIAREAMNNGGNQKIRKLVRDHVRKKFKAKNFLDRIPDGDTWEGFIDGFIDHFINRSGSITLGADGKLTYGTMKGIETWFEGHMTRSKERAVLKPSLTPEEEETITPYLQMMVRLKVDEPNYGQKRKIMEKISEGMTVFDFQGAIMLVHDLDASFKNADYILGRMYSDNYDNIKSFGKQTERMVKQRLQKEAQSKSTHE